jgi:tetratricopeptide (TPR) repeat protein
MSPRRRQRFGRAAGYTGYAVVSGVVLQIVREVAANQLNVLGAWVPWTVIIAGSVIGLVLWILSFLWPPERPEPPLERWLPRVDKLIGRESTVATVLARARSHGVVVVHGPSGIGTSSVAITAARLLVPDVAGQLYVDLRKVRPNSVWPARIPLLRDSTRWVRMPVLRTLGLDPRMSDEEATQAVADKLRGSGLVLVIDNAAEVNEVRWVAHGVDGARIIIAGEIRTNELTGVADVPVQGLEPEDALRLLRHQDAEPTGGRFKKLVDRVWHAQSHSDVQRCSIAERVNDERKPARELAEHYLQHPRVAIQFARWLSQNPGEKISDLLRILEQGGPVVALDQIMDSALAGMSGAARLLLAQLVTAPDVEFSDAAVAALARISVEDADLHLTELSRRFLVHRSSSGSRVARPATHLAGKIPDNKAAKVHIRLVAFYAKLADANAVLLGGEQYAEGARWFAAQDVTLLGLLGVPSPPKRAASHLWQITDALDLWFAREERNRERWDVAEAMLARAREVGDVTAQAVALIRMAAIARRDARTSDARKLLNEAEALGHGRTPWRPQLNTEWALCNATDDDLEAARNDVLHAQQARPQRDLEGRMIDLINLAWIEIGLGRHDPAVDHLHKAVRLAKQAGSIAGHAQARELTGVALRRQGHTGAAEDAWIDAESLYRSIGDDAGRARCERHRVVEEGGQP